MRALARSIFRLLRRHRGSSALLQALDVPVRRSVSGVRFPIHCRLTSNHWVNDGYDLPSRFSFRRLCQVLAPRGLFDVGANVGLYAAEFATQVPEGRILAAEPNSRVFPFLQRTCAGIGPRAFAVRMAASDSAGEAELRFDPMAPAMGGILPGPDGLYNSQRRYGGFLVSERVATVTVDALAAEHFVPDLLKIDAEGADALILKGAEEMLAAHRPALFFEVDRDHERIRAMLESRGYVPLDAELRVKHQALGMCFALHRERHADAIGALCG